LLLLSLVLISLTQWRKPLPPQLLPLLLPLLVVLQTPLPLLKRKRKKKQPVSTVLVPFSVETGIERRRAHLKRDMLALSEAR
jgi:hypothetical protein